MTNTQDHRHCPTKDSPCGIEGEHRCCLCGKPVGVERIVEEIREEFKGEQFEWPLVDKLTQALQSYGEACREEERERIIRYTREYDVNQITEGELREALIKDV